jgi:hypothetical protein
MNSLIPLKGATVLFFVALALLYFAVLPKAQAVIPPPDGGYPNFTTAEGQNAVKNLTTGAGNTAVGWFSLESVTTGSYNTGVGAGTLVLNTGDSNTAVGIGALLLNTAGFQNTAVGARALFSDTTAFGNTANGAEALSNNTTGSGNVAIGAQALNLNTTGTSNIALGFSAGANITGDDNIDIGSTGGLSESGTIRIGQNGSQTSTFIAGIRGVTTINPAIPVLIDTVGQLGTMSSSKRFKKEIKPIDKASEAILAFKPVTFHYQSDTKDTPQFGLIAEEVADVNPDLVVRDKNGEIYTVRYEAVNAMLLNEFLKEHKKVEQLESTVASLAATVKEQAAQFRKVTAQIELSKAVRQTALNSP